MEQLQKDFQRREKIIKTLECDELLFLQDRKQDIKESVEIEIEVKGCLNGK